MRELAADLGMERTTLVRALKPMQRDGWVLAVSAPADSRQNVISLTSTGERKLRFARPLWENAQQAFEQKFGKGQADDVRAALLAITAATRVDED